MRSKNFRRLPVVLILCAAVLVNSCTQNSTQDKNPRPMAEQGKNAVIYKVTFIELGSVRCIPCQQMQPIMKSVREKYGTQVNVVFHDVWTEAGAPYAQKYGIKAIPTQVFLDETGKEYFRHVGFFPEEELIKMLQQKAVK